MDDHALIDLRDVVFEYEPGRPLLVCPSLCLGRGVTLVLGPNGAGKSTLLRLIAGVERPTRGTVHVGGLELWEHEVDARRRMTYVPEHPELTPYASVVDVVRLACRLRGQPDHVAAEAIERVGLLEAGWRTVRELSLGQRRRAMLATALVGDPEVVVLDEPLESMDRATRDFLLARVAEWRDRGACVLVATHELEPFSSLADGVVSVRGGRLAHLTTLPEAAAERMALFTKAATVGV